jgi:hypothetical protein
MSKGTNYIFQIIWDLYNGDTHFYTVIEKQKFKRFVEEANRLLKTMPATLQEWFSKIDSLRTKDEVTNWTPIGDKTVTDINSGRQRLTLGVHKKICKGIMKELMDSFDESFRIKVQMSVNEKEVPAELTNFLLIILGSLYSQISGSLRSEYGKTIDTYYLTYLFEALGATREGGELSTITQYLDGSKLYYTLGKRWVCTNGTLKRVSGSKGREVDGLIYTITTNKKFIPLIAIEFTIGGRGNPSAAVNKAKSIAGLKSCLKDGIVFFAYDLGELRRDIDPVVTQIYFKEQTKTRPIEIVYNLLQKRLRDTSQDQIKLHSLESCKSNFRDRIVKSCKVD